MAMILERNSLWYSDNDNHIRLLVSDVLNILYAPVAHIVRIAELAPFHQSHESIHHVLRQLGA